MGVSIRGNPEKSGHMMDWDKRLAPSIFDQKTNTLENRVEKIEDALKAGDEKSLAAIEKAHSALNKMVDCMDEVSKRLAKIEDREEMQNLGTRVGKLEDDMEAIGKCVNDLVRGAVPEAVNYGVNKPWMNDRNRETAARSVYGYLENDSVCGHIRSDIVGAKVDEVISRYGTGANSKMVAEIVRLHFQTREGRLR